MKKKTNEILQDMVTIINGETKDMMKIENPCQMWKNVDAKFTEFGKEAQVIVHRADGTEYKNFTLKLMKNGKYIKINAIKETNRAQVAKRKAKLAKRREYDRKRRAAKRLEKQNAQDAQA